MTRPSAGPGSAEVVRLTPLTADDEAAARQAHTELAGDDFRFLLDWQPDLPWSDHLRLLRDRRCGIDVPADQVPATFLAARVGADLVGRVSIRHGLDDFLATRGGHVGYAVRPAFRGRGYATQVLRQALVVARAEGVDDVLVTCQDHNAASAATILRCGGVLEDVRTAHDGHRYRRYWIR